MRQWVHAIAAIALLWIACPTGAVAADADSPAGLWKTVDDKTGAVTALIRIVEHDGRFSGHIEKSFRPGAETRVCTVCSDDRKGKPIVGLEIIRGMSRHDDEYTGGEILDPDSGSVYRCRFHLEADGQKLVVRGYIGISLLGRSQTWTREP